MAKGTRVELKPDDPIFSGRPQVFVPVSRPPTATSQKPAADDKPKPQGRPKK